MQVIQATYCPFLPELHSELVSLYICTSVFYIYTHTISFALKEVTCYLFVVIPDWLRNLVWILYVIATINQFIRHSKLVSDHCAFQMLSVVD